MMMKLNKVQKLKTNNRVTLLHGMPDWLLSARQYASSRIIREHETEQIGLMLTSSEIIVANEHGVQVAPLHQIVKVGKEAGQLLIASNGQELIRAVVDLSKETLNTFFMEAREVTAQARVAAEEKAKRIEETRIAAQASATAEAAEMQRLADEQRVLEETQKFGRTPGVAVSARPEDLIARGERVSKAVELPVTPRMSSPIDRWVEEAPDHLIYEYASRGKRFFAAMIDNIALGFFLGVINRQAERGNLFSALLALLIPLAYYVFLESSYGATLGKMAMGIQVTTMEDGRINLPRALLRYVARAVPIVAAYLIVLISRGNIVMLILGVIIILIAPLAVFFTPHRQAIHDLIAKTVVVNR
jgi:uncharacterized RDD family membrane protein YckC